MLVVIYVAGEVLNRDQRMEKLPLLLLGLLLGTCCGVRAQSFDLTTGRVPVASLDGLWRFHTGDDPAWAAPNFEDSGWSLLRSDQSWSSQGYKNYSGMAWYRFQVTVPDGLDHVSLYLRHIYTGYEVYADGKLIGTYGKMPPNSLPYLGGGRSQVYLLTGGRRGKKMIQVALRVWQWPGWVTYKGGGPLNGGALVGIPLGVMPKTNAIARRLALKMRKAMMVLTNSSIEASGEYIGRFTVPQHIRGRYSAHYPPLH